MKKTFSIFICFYFILGLYSEQFEYIPECSYKVESHEWVEHTAYSLCYNEHSEQPEFTVFEMTKSEAKNLGTAPRNDNFRKDKSVSTKSAELSDYRKSGYSRGHLVASNDMSYSEKTLSETFFMSNISPQLQRMNSGAWLAIERFTQSFLLNDGSEYNSVYIYNIPLVNKDFPAIEFIGKNDVAVPIGFFKVMYIPEADEFMCWYVAQKSKDIDSSADNAKNYLVPLEKVEKESGLFFSFSQKSSKYY